MDYIRFLIFQSKFVFAFSVIFSKELFSQNIDSISKNLPIYNDYYLILVKSSINKQDTNRFRFDDLDKLKSKLDLEYNSAIKKGYIYSTYHLDTFIAVNNKVLSIYYTMNLGQSAIVDSVLLRSTNEKLNLSAVNKILKQNLNSESNIDQILKMMSSFPFIELESRPVIERKDSSHILILTVRESKNNQINAIVGLLPNAGESNSFLLTGDVSLKLSNLFHRFIGLNLNWQKTQSNSQFLFLKTSIPYLFSTPFGLNYSLNIEKFDSSYSRSYHTIGLDYAINPNQTFSIFFKNQSSSLDGIDFTELNAGKIPKNLDYSFSQLGLGYKSANFTENFFVKSGFSIEGFVLTGQKIIKKNNRITSEFDIHGVSFGKFYDSIPLESFNLSYLLHLVNYSQLSERIVMKAELESKGIFSNSILQNEFYQFGGIRKPRGFNDNSFLSPFYATLSTNFHYYFNKNLYSNIFADMSIIRNSFEDSFMLPIGFGLGFSLRSSASIFQLNFGFGVQENQAFSLSNNKIHINYVNVF